MNNLNMNNINDILNYLNKCDINITFILDKLNKYISLNNNIKDKILNINNDKNLQDFKNDIYEINNIFQNFKNYVGGNDDIINNDNNNDTIINNLNKILPLLDEINIILQNKFINNNGNNDYNNILDIEFNLDNINNKIDKVYDYYKK